MRQTKTLLYLWCSVFAFAAAHVWVTTVKLFCLLPYGILLSAFAKVKIFELLLLIEEDEEILTTLDAPFRCSVFRLQAVEGCAPPFSTIAPSFLAYQNEEEQRKKKGEHGIISNYSVDWGAPVPFQHGSISYISMGKLPALPPPVI